MPDIWDWLYLIFFLALVVVCLGGTYALCAVAFVGWLRDVLRWWLLEGKK